jgi:hypothetical protein
VTTFIVAALFLDFISVSLDSVVNRESGLNRADNSARSPALESMVNVLVELESN